MDGQPPREGGGEPLPRHGSAVRRDWPSSRMPSGGRATADPDGPPFIRVAPPSRTGPGPDRHRRWGFSRRPEPDIVSSVRRASSCCASSSPAKAPVASYQTLAGRTGRSRRSFLEVDVVGVVVVAVGQRLGHVLAHGPETVAAALRRRGGASAAEQRGRRGHAHGCDRGKVREYGGRSGGEMARTGDGRAGWQNNGLFAYSQQTNSRGRKRSSPLMQGSLPPAANIRSRLPPA